MPLNKRHGMQMVQAALQAFADKLSGDQQRMLHDALAERLVIPGEGEGLRHKRMTRLVCSVRDAAQLTDKPLSITEYRRIRRERPDLDLVDDGTLRRWAGGTWNDVLALAGLDRVADGDVIDMPHGPHFTRLEVLEAVRAWLRDAAPGRDSFDGFLGWAEEADLLGLPGRRPHSQAVFDRLFGGWMNARRLAGLPPGDLDDDPQLRIRMQRGYKWTPEQILDAIRQAATHYGRSPTVGEYIAYRQQLLDLGNDEGFQALPSYPAVHRRYPEWDRALEAAGLRPRGGRGVSSTPRPAGTAGPRFTLDQVNEALRQASAEITGPFTATAYRDWRDTQIALARSDGRWIDPIPSYDAIRKHYASWTAACRGAFTGTS